MREQNQSANIGAPIVIVALLTAILISPVMAYGQRSDITYSDVGQRYTWIDKNETRGYCYFGDDESCIEYSYQTDAYGYRFANGIFIAPPNYNTDQFYLDDEVRYQGYLYKIAVIADNACKGNKEISTARHTLNGYLSIPQYVKVIGRHAFDGCTGFTGLKFRGRDVKEIRAGAFAGCYNLEDISIPSSVKVIGDEAFRGCTGLKWQLTLYDLDSIGARAFMNCTSLNGLNISGCKYIGIGAFQACKGVTSIVLPKNLKYIDKCAFRYCDGFKGMLILPDSIEIINDQAFFGCTFMGLPHLPSELKGIGNNAFEGCNGILGSLVIPDKVEAISHYAFSGCSNISESITIGKSVDRIGVKAFWNIGKINRVIVKAETPPQILIGDPFMDEVYENAVLVVPPGAKDSYASAEYWSKFVAIEEGNDNDNVDRIYPESFDLYSGKLKIYDNPRFDNIMPGHIILPIGESRRIDAIIYPETATETKLFWASENPEIAAVDNGVHCYFKGACHNFCFYGKWLAAAHLCGSR